MRPHTRFPAMIAAAMLLFNASLANAQQPSLSDQIGLSEKLLELEIESLNVSPEFRRTLSRAVRLDPRIVGGEPVSIEDHPWQVALVRGAYADPNRFQFCGGTLIHKQWVLTAAHCIDNFIVSGDPTRVDVVAGAEFYPYGGIRMSVSEIALHPGYSDASLDFDFAMLKLEAPLENFEPVAYADGAWEFSPGDVATVTGWGAIIEGGQGSEDLLGAQVPLVATRTCNRSESYNGQITENMLCAGDRDGGIDACQGDSGGPLTEERDGRRTLIGVVSWGEGCARRLKYGVYSRVSRVSSWIDALLAK